MAKSKERLASGPPEKASPENALSEPARSEAELTRAAVPGLMTNPEDGSEDRICKAADGRRSRHAPTPPCGGARPSKPEEMATLARDCGETCIKALLDEVENGKGATRIAAARELLERGYGKPRQPLEVSDGVDMRREPPEEIRLFLSRLERNEDGNS